MNKKKGGKGMEQENQTAEVQKAAEAAADMEGQTEVSPATEPEPEKKGRAARREAELKKQLEEQKAACEAALAAEKDKYLRLAAEYDNYRRRSQKERESIYDDARTDTITKLLPVYDNLDRALKAECADPAFYKGVEMTMEQLMEIFGKLGVAPIEAAGQSFDPAAHNAVLHVEDENLGENTVAEEFQRGFTLNGKVIRFAMVKVAN